jgi:hypothetical protein
MLSIRSSSAAIRCACAANKALTASAPASKVEELKRLLGRNSNNSSTAPSKDSREAREQRPKKRSSGKKQGGQPGHPGRHRQMVAAPDHVVEHGQSAIALEEPYLEILTALDQEPVRGADETSWPQAGTGQWLSVSTSDRMALFQIAKRRDRDAAIALLGEQPEGVIVTDRYAVYLFLDDTQRQMCLAHVARDLVALSERDGAPGRLGRQLARELGAVFGVLHQPGRDTDDLKQLREDIAAHRQAFHDLLAKGARG